MLFVLLVLGFLLLAPARLLGRALFRIVVVVVIIGGLIALVGHNHQQQPAPTTMQ